MVNCPQCGTPIQPTWDWCHGCGFDPEGLKPEGWQPGAPLASPPPPAFAAPPPEGGPRPGSAPPPGPRAPFSAPGYGTPPPAPASSGGSGTSVLKILVGCGLAFLLVVFVCIAAVTLLGSNASTKVTKLDAASTASTAATAPNWTVWQGATGTSVEFPCAPDASAQAPTVTVYSAQMQVGCKQGEIAFQALASTYAPGFVPDNVDGMLDGAVQGMAKASEATVSNVVKGTYQGHPSVTADLTFPQGAQGRAMGVITPTDLYLTIVIGTTLDPAAVQRFQQSLHIAP